jgi:ferredoxin
MTSFAFDRKELCNALRHNATLFGLRRYRMCPVDCIYGLSAQDPAYRRQLFIHPDECITCAACEPECPWGAIFEDNAVPDIFKEDVEINAKVFQDHPAKEFTTIPIPILEHPSPAQIEENNKKWGYKK